MKTSAVGPLQSTRRLMRIAWSQYSGTDPRLWVEISITRPSSRSSVRSRTIASSVVTSTPVNGSSSRITRPSWASARARKTRFFWPPESSPICRRRKSVMPTRASAASTSARSSADGRRSQPMWP